MLDDAWVWINIRLLEKQVKASQPNITDSLVRACRRGDRQAQYRLYQMYAKAMLNTCYRIVNRVEDAEDVLQEAFVKAFEKLHTYRGDATFGAWLKRIVINTAVSFARKKNMNFESLDNYDLPEEHDRLVEIEPDIIASAERAREALHQLSDGYRTVFSLYVLEGYDHSEIADILGISPSTSVSQLSRAKQKLRNLLKKMPSHG